MRIVRRLLDADGSTHVRALAYETVFLAMSGLIGLVGLASLLHASQLRGVVGELARSISPGPAGSLLAEAAQRGAQSGGTAAAIGLAVALGSGTLAMAQIERSANRLAGSAEDRPLLRRFVVAFVLAATLGVVLTGGALVLAGGRALASGLGWGEAATDAWAIARWPIGIALAAGAIVLLFRLAPARRLGPRRAILLGAGAAVGLWVVFTALLSWWFSIRSTASPYGPLLSVVALLLWSMLTSMALHLGLAATCELAGSPPPRVAVPPGEVIDLPEAAPASR